MVHICKRLREWHFYEVQNKFYLHSFRNCSLWLYMFTCTHSLCTQLEQLTEQMCPYSEPPPSAHTKWELLNATTSFLTLFYRFFVHWWRDWLRLLSEALLSEKWQRCFFGWLLHLVFHRLEWKKNGRWKKNTAAWSYLADKLRSALQAKLWPWKQLAQNLAHGHFKLCKAKFYSLASLFLWCWKALGACENCDRFAWQFRCVASFCKNVLQLAT